MGPLELAEILHTLLDPVTAARTPHHHRRLRVLYRQQQQDSVGENLVLVPILNK